MVILKCKICGGSLEVQEGVSIAKCQYCGTQKAVPKLENENVQNKVAESASSVKRKILAPIRDILPEEDGVHAAFMAAVMSQKLSLAEQLLNEGADIDVIDKFGETALMKAILKRNIDMVKLLIDNGADTGIVNKGGRTALALAINRNRFDMVELLRNYGVET